MAEATFANTVRIERQQARDVQEDQRRDGGTHWNEQTVSLMKKKTNDLDLRGRVPSAVRVFIFFL